MSRESDELGEKQHNEQFAGKGPFDPDLLGYPGEAPLETGKNKDAILAEINQLSSTI